MTEVIDSFNPRKAPGRSKAVTLFALTTVGSFLKLLFVGIWVWIITALGQPFGADSAGYKELRWIVFTGVLIILFGLINFAGSLLMLKRIKAGLWIYLVSQALTLGAITYTILALSTRINTAAQFFLGLTWIVTGVYVALYISNMQYYNRNKPFDNTFFESENDGNTSLNP